MTFFGRSRNVETLSESDVQRFVLARRQGVGSLLRVQPGKVVRQLFGRGVIVTEKPQGIRVATHFFNNEQDVERLMAGLGEIR